MAASSNLSKVIFRLSSKELSGEVTLTPVVWRVLVQCDGTRTVAEIAQGLKLEESGVGQIAETLFRSGILQVAPGSVAPPRPTVNGAFIEQITTELARAIGPLAALTLEDEIAALDEIQESFPRERIPELIERLGQAIPDDARRLRFQQVMLAAIRKL
jgi:hypothetical protein